MDELDRLKVRRDRQARIVARLDREVTALRNRDGRRRASREALEGVLARHRETLRQFSTEVDAADPKPAPCAHVAAVRVELSTGELAAWLCPGCDQQLPPEWFEDGSRRSRRRSQASGRTARPPTTIPASAALSEIVSTMVRR